MSIATMADVAESLSGLVNQEVEIDNAIDDALLGKLVTAGKLKADAVKDVKKVMANSTKRNMLSTTLTRGQRFTLSQTGKLNVQDKVALAKGDLAWNLGDYYMRRKLNVQNGNQEDLNQASYDQSVGLQNFDKNELPQGVTITIDRIKVSYGYHATETSPEARTYTNAMDAETAGSTPVAIPPHLINGEFEFRINGRTRLRIPVKRFYREGLSVSNNIEGVTDVLVLSSPIILKGGEKFNCLIHYANNAGSVQSGNHFLEVRFMGDALSPRQ